MLWDIKKSLNEITKIKTEPTVLGGLFKILNCVGVPLAELKGQEKIVKRVARCAIFESKSESDGGEMKGEFVFNSCQIDGELEKNTKDIWNFNS